MSFEIALRIMHQVPLPSFTRTYLHTNRTSESATLFQLTYSLPGLHYLPVLAPLPLNLLCPVLLVSNLHLADLQTAFLCLLPLLLPLLLLLLLPLLPILPQSVPGFLSNW